LNQPPVRVLVVDDTVIYRKVVADILARLPGVEVVGVAANGKIALQKIEQLNPDLLTLDIEMPEMDGLAVLGALKERRFPAKAIMLSSLTSEGADATLAALSLGAFDFVVKPAGVNVIQNAAVLEEELRDKLEAFRATRPFNRLVAPPPAPKPAVPPPAPTSAADVARRMSRLALPAAKPEVVAIGISTGGPPALCQMLPRLPGDLPTPVLVVQHMPPKFTLSLARDLATKCNLDVAEAADGDLVVPGRILIAPGGHQMKVEKAPDRETLVIRITDDPPENHCRPSVDYLFRSLAHACAEKVVGVIMTGMGSDGTLGCRLLKRGGASIIAQNEATCVVFGMPKQPVEEGLADAVLPLGDIAGQITRLAGRGVATCR
jgi:two-component system, chemotaxis family, protein-glutamate methylesterase/glutaminase